jgi:mitochondrial pyruvate carrier 1
MTVSLAVYSAVFMRYSLAVTPKNYLLFGCHLINCSSQIVQGYRFQNYWYQGGREEVLKQKAASGLTEAKQTAEAAKEKVVDAAKSAVGK